MDDPTERWLPVPGYEGLYEVSDLGRVRSLDRDVATRNSVRHYRGRILRQMIDNHGYPEVGLSLVGDVKTWHAHSLVLTAFAGRCPPGMECRHGPGGKQDASLSNLCWGTRTENIADRLRDGQDNYGEHSGQAKLTWEKVRDIRRRVANGEYQSDLAAEYRVCKQTVCLVVHNRTWIESD